MSHLRTNKAWLAGAIMGLLVVSLPQLALATPWTPSVTPACNQAPTGTGTFTMTANAIGTGSCSCVVLLANNQTLKISNHAIFCATGDVAGVCMNGSFQKLQGPGVIQGCSSPGSAGVSIAGTTGGEVQAVQVFGNDIGISDATGLFVTKLLDNFAFANGTVGIEYSGAGLVVMKGNHVTSNSLGISVTAGKALLDSNYVLNNTGDGISITSPTAGTQLQGNYTLGNGGDGIAISSPGAIVTLNQANGNSGYGIDLTSSSTSCRMIKNIAHGNAGGNDLFDANVACGSNTWTADIYEFSSPSSCAH